MSKPDLITSIRDELYQIYGKDDVDKIINLLVNHGVLKHQNDKWYLDITYKNSDFVQRTLQALIDMSQDISECRIDCGVVKLSKLRSSFDYRTSPVITLATIILSVINERNKEFDVSTLSPKDIRILYDISRALFFTVTDEIRSLLIEVSRILDALMNIYIIYCCNEPNTEDIALKN